MSPMISWLISKRFMGPDYTIQPSPGGSPLRGSEAWTTPQAKI